MSQIGHGGDAAAVPRRSACLLTSGIVSVNDSNVKRSYLVAGPIVLSIALLSSCSGMSSGSEGTSGAAMPTVLESTLFFGGSGDETLSWLDRPFILPDGGLLLSGETLSADLPVTSDALDPEYSGGNVNGREDSFLVMIDSDIQQVRYASYVGGSEGPDFVSDLVATSDGTFYVVGSTGAADYPITDDALVAEQPGPYFRHADGVLTILGENGRTLEYSSFVGARGIDWLTHVFVDESDGTITLFGITDSNHFPPGEPLTEDGLQATPTIFALRLDSDRHVLMSHLLANSWTLDVEQLPSGDFVIVGNTTDPGFVGSEGAYDTDFNGGIEQSGGDFFVMRLSADLVDVEFVTLFGGSGEELYPRIAVVDGEDIVLVGRTTSADLPISRGAQMRKLDTPGAMLLARLSADGSELIHCTYWGSGEPWDAVTSIAYGTDGRVYLAGTTASESFPVTDDAFDPEFSGQADAFIVVMETERFTTQYATYLGGDEEERQISIVLDGDDRLIVAGSTNSGDFPTPAGGAAPGGSPAPNGWDIFVAEFGR